MPFGVLQPSLLSRECRFQLLHSFSSCPTILGTPLPNVESVFVVLYKKVSLMRSLLSLKLKRNVVAREIAVPWNWRLELRSQKKPLTLAELDKGAWSAFFDLCNFGSEGNVNWVWLAQAVSMLKG